MHIKKYTVEDVLNNVRRYIESFLVVESHYCRSVSNRKFLGSLENASIMKFKESFEKEEFRRLDCTRSKSTLK